jgi:hypothetical protein
MQGGYINGNDDYFNNYKKKSRKIHKSTGFTKLKPVYGKFAKFIGVKNGTELSGPETTKKVWEQFKLRGLTFQGDGNHHKDERILRVDDEVSKLLNVPMTVNNSTNHRDANGLNFSNLQRYINNAMNNNQNDKNTDDNDDDNDNYIEKKFTIESLSGNESVVYTENMILKMNYIVTIDDIVKAFEANFSTKLLLHLLSYKIKFDANNVNKIIASCQKRTDLSQVLVSIKNYGYDFNKNDCLNILKCDDSISYFSQNIKMNIEINKELINDILKIDSFLFVDNVISFLKNLEQNIDNKESAEYFLAVYCCFFSICDTDCIINKINNLKTKYNIKLTKLCMKCIFNNHANIKTPIMDMFKNDGVVPDIELLRDYIKSHVPKKEYDELDNLFK